MKKLLVGIDNGVSGTIGIIGPKTTSFIKTPVVSEQNYTKKKGNISRINIKGLRDVISKAMFENEITDPSEISACIERPMINPTRFAASISAVRALEATLIVLEDFKIPFQYLDSKEWQKVLLPKGMAGPDLKKASKDIGGRLFPQFKEFKHEDRDGILMAEYLRRLHH